MSIGIKRVLLIGVLASGCTGQGSLIQDRLVSMDAGTQLPASNNCQELGSVTGVSIKKAGRGEAYRQSLVDLKRAADNLGGNFVKLDRISTDSTFLTGRAYHCVAVAKE